MRFRASRAFLAAYKGGRIPQTNLGRCPQLERHRVRKASLGRVPHPAAAPRCTPTPHMRR
eukprot:scaffold287_cov239-Pinguiococcus_pyrenoidosus.AAC.3